MNPPHEEVPFGPITPQQGSFFHAESHEYARAVWGRPMCPRSGTSSTKWVSEILTFSTCFCCAERQPGRGAGPYPLLGVDLLTRIHCWISPHVGDADYAIFPQALTAASTNGQGAIRRVICAPGHDQPAKIDSRKCEVEHSGPSQLPKDGHRSTGGLGGAARTTQRFLQPSTPGRIPNYGSPAASPRSRISAEGASSAGMISAAICTWHPGQQ